MKRQFLIILIAAVIILFFAYSVFNFIHKNEISESPGTAQEITASDVATHNSISNCWIIVGSKVYNLTAYTTSHPTDTRYSTLCGQDATLHLTSDAPSAQSAKVLEQLQAYYIGIIAP